MREIKFRALNHETGEWVYGWYTKLVEGIRRFNAIITEVDGELIRFYIHDASTISQYIGLKDKHGHEVYEGDICTWYINEHTRTGLIYYDNQTAGFWIQRDIDTGYLVCNDWLRGEYEVIGNIHENPELLEKR